MNTKTQAMKWNDFAPAMLGLLAAALILVVLANANAQLPLISNDRGALVALVVVGMAMCSVGGIGKAIGLYGWKHPITLAGNALGVLILVVFAAVLLGIPLPLIASDRAAFVAITLIGAIKVAIITGYNVVSRHA